MAPRTSWDGDALTNAAGSAGSVLGGLKVAPADVSNVDPDIAATLSDNNRDTEAEIDDGKSATDRTKEAVENLDDSDEENRGEFDGVNPGDTALSGDGSGAETASARGGGLSGSGSPMSGSGSPMSGTGSEGMRPLMSATVPASQTAPPMQMPQMQMPQMQMPSMPSMGSGATPMSGSFMPQYALNSSPNREQLIRQLLDNPEASTSGGSLGEKSSEGMVRKIQEIAEKIVNAGIPYAWGGGHGDQPGPSQGIRDGGTADRFGDYRKTGVDCSGLARWVTYLATDGRVDINGTSQMQFQGGRVVSPDNARPGDIFFPDSAGVPPRHVQVYVGNGMVVEAMQSGTNVMFNPIQSGKFRRYYEY
jgi:cell wall-associated NlpC family hydrolase